MKALAITITAALGLFLAVIGWFIIRSDPMGGEPIVVVEIDPDSRPTTGNSRASIPDLKEPPQLVPLPHTGPAQQSLPAQAFS
ncbi:MAG: hypothetical protein ACE5FM_01815, partial [Methyloligellaceae bacterium]